MLGRPLSPHFPEIRAMSAELQSLSSDQSADFPYRAVCRAAVVSVVCFVLAAFGLMPTFVFLLALTIPGIIAAVSAFRSISKFPNEFSGLDLAKFGLAANLLLLVSGVSLHTYIYLTEVPDGYERVPFYKLQQPESRADSPTELAFLIDGKPVFLKGYIHPSSGSGRLKQFILVPDLGTCCFGGQPRSSDMIEVTLTGGQTVKANLSKRKLAGTFTLNQAPMKLTDFENAVFYRMRIDQIK